MSEFFSAINHNTVLLSALTAWLIAQVLKTLLVLIQKEELSMERLVGAGGMPSSHTALVVGLASAVGFRDGWGSTSFAIAVVLAGIVMYDAAGVRRAAGKQAKVLNRLIAQLRTEHTIRDVKLKELLGHEPLEVMVGALLGFAISFYFHTNS